MGNFRLQFFYVAFSFPLMYCGTIVHFKFLYLRRVPVFPLSVSQGIQIYIFFQSRKVRVIAVGVGKEIDNSELKEIAMGDSKHVIHISNFGDLIKNMDELLDKACKENQ